MENEKGEEKIILPHHEQQELCQTRLPYRQGRKLTAVKVYSITKESNHLLVFGVPSLKLRQEAKALFLKFGKLLQFNISKEHAAEAFTETYHARYEKIHSARIAKKMLDTKNFYGGSLHICYAPELETIEETQQKLMQRQKDVLFRLRNLQNERLKEESNKKEVELTYDAVNSDKKLLNMGEFNLINAGKEHKKRKRKIRDEGAAEKRFKPCFVDKPTVNDFTINNRCTIFGEPTVNKEVVNDRCNSNDKYSFNNEVDDDKSPNYNVKRSVKDVTELEVVDCTSTDKTTISNINEALNYNKFGDEAVFKMPPKPVNKIKFNLNKKSLSYSMSYLKLYSKLNTLKYLELFIKKSNGIVRKIDMFLL